MRMNKNGNLHEHERSLKTRLRLRSGIKLALEGVYCKNIHYHETNTLPVMSA